MTIHEYCKNENCELIKMGCEYLLIHKDKYVISRITKDGEFDIKSNPKSHKLFVFVPPIFIIFYLFMIIQSIYASDYAYLSLNALGAISFLLVYIYFFLYSSAEPVIQKEKVIKIFKGKILNSIFIKYRDKNNKIKIRGVTCPGYKNERELAFQLLKKYVEDEK